MHFFIENTTKIHQSLGEYLQYQPLGRYMTHTVRMYVCAVSALVPVHKYQPWVVFSAVHRSYYFTEFSSGCALGKLRKVVPPKIQCPGQIYTVFSNPRDEETFTLGFSLGHALVKTILSPRVCRPNRPVLRTYGTSFKSPTTNLLPYLSDLVHCPLPHAPSSIVHRPSSIVHRTYIRWIAAVKYGRPGTLLPAQTI